MVRTVSSPGKAALQTRPDKHAGTHKEARSNRNRCEFTDHDLLLMRAVADLPDHSLPFMNKHELAFAIRAARLRVPTIDQTNRLDELDRDVLENLVCRARESCRQKLLNEHPDFYARGPRTRRPR